MFKTSFLKVKSKKIRKRLKVKKKEGKVLKGNKLIVNRALLGSRQVILEVLERTCATIYPIGFMFNISSKGQEID